MEKAHVPRYRFAKPTQKAISLVVTAAFLVNIILQDLAIANPLNATEKESLSVWTAVERPEANRAILASMYRNPQNRLIWRARSDRYRELLARYNAASLLLPSGRYLMSPETAADDLALIRAVTHADFNILMQYEARTHPAGYTRLLSAIMADETLVRLYRPLSACKDLSAEPRHKVFNDLVAKAFELYIIVRDRIADPEKELTPDERRLLAAIRPVLEGKSGLAGYLAFPDLFFDNGKRLRTVLQLQKDKKEAFERAAAPRAGVKTEPSMESMPDPQAAPETGRRPLPKSDRLPRYGHTEPIAGYIERLHGALEKKDYSEALKFIMWSLAAILKARPEDLPVANFRPFMNNLSAFVAAVYPDNEGPGYEEFHDLLRSSDIADMRLRMSKTLPKLLDHGEAMKAMMRGRFAAQKRTVLGMDEYDVINILVEIVERGLNPELERDKWKFEEVFGEAMPHLAAAKKATADTPLDEIKDNIDKFNEGMKRLEDLFRETLGKCEKNVKKTGYFKPYDDADVSRVAQAFFRGLRTRFEDDINEMRDMSAELVKTATAGDRGKKYSRHVNSILWMYGKEVVPILVSGIHPDIAKVECTADGEIDFGALLAPVIFRDIRLYFFGNKRPDGRKHLSNIIGTKAANLLEMDWLGLPVPPGFVMADKYSRAIIHHLIPKAVLAKCLAEGVKEIERRSAAMTGDARRFGDADNPLFLSVRSGAKKSHPGKFLTALPVGLERRTINGYAKRVLSEKKAWWDYIEFIRGYPLDDEKTREELFQKSGVLLGTRPAVKMAKSAAMPAWEALGLDELKSIATDMEGVFKSVAGRDFPGAERQITDAVAGVVSSYKHSMGLVGLGVTVQEYYAGDRQDGRSYSGVVFSRDMGKGYGDGLYGRQDREGRERPRCCHAPGCGKLGFEKLYKSRESRKRGRLNRPVQGRGTGYP